MDDLTLIKKILNGDEKSFETLLLKYQFEISKYVYSNVRDNEETKDIVQDIFSSTYNKLYTFNQDCKFKTWLYTIAGNKCINYIRGPERNSCKSTNKKRTFLRFIFYLYFLINFHNA